MEGADGAATMLGDSPQMQVVRGQIRRVAPTQASVMLFGESGSGKELAARAVHEQSERAGAPFVAINCAAIAPGLIEAELFGHEKGSFTGAVREHAGVFERADGGTLFLDEITEMPSDLQVRLLRVLETGRFFRVGGAREIVVDVRVVAATNHGLELAPLLMATPTAVQPGLARRSLAGGAGIPIEVGVNLKDAERSLIEATLQHFDGNKTQAAETLGCSLKTLYNKLNAYAREAAFSNS